ncbi:urease accessory protein UreD [Streptomyces decoyicus]|uniref:urease accessory protein UreD n=1 Tax=Streptomyces decoyicus TaxID=249567 RepID=UPI00345D42FA
MAREGVGISSGAQLAETGASFALAASTKETCGHPDGVHATARIRATYNGRVTTLPQLRSDGPFPLRRMPTNGKTARVGIIGAMSAPLGGDRLALDITAEDRAELDVTTAAATLALRAPTAPATYDVLLTAREHARLRWLPQPLISAAGSNLHQTYTVYLAATSRLLLREEQLLGRTNEKPGHLVSRIRVHHAGRLLLDQHMGIRRPDGTAPRSWTDTAPSANSSWPQSWTSGVTPSCSAKRPRTAVRSSRRWPTAQPCSPQPSHQPPRPCESYSTKHSATPSASSAAQTLKQCAKTGEPNAQSELLASRSLKPT